MAAAYAALVSLTHIIEQITKHHPRKSFLLDKQKRQLESLQKKVSFLQDFLEAVYSSEGSDTKQEGLESRIAEVAYAAEDIIESYVVDIILPQAPNKQSKHKNKGAKKEVISQGKSASNLFLHGLQKIIESIDSMKKEVMVVKEKTRVEDLKASDLMHVVLSRYPNMGKDIKVEYYGKDLEQIMDKLTGQSSNLQIIAIVGMGGIGKTTLARNIYNNKLIVECFDIRAWVTISQEYNLQQILFGLLHQIGLSTDEQERCEYHRLGERLYKHLSGRKYLIIIDDMWSVDVWEKLMLFLPNNNNERRVIITTRLLSVVDGFDPSCLYKMKLLDENKSWSLLCTKVFGHDGNCPLELEEIGKDIAKNCKGLPLSIAVIGGLLAKSEKTKKYWEYVAKDINQIVNSEENGRWLNILYLSYSQLPIHLKPCFLYMGSFKENYDIRISELIKLWVAEGFLKTCKGKSLEEVAEDYLNDLIDRNLVFVRDWGSIGKMKTCGIHDLLRDLCLKEAHKKRFFCVVKKSAQSVDNERRIIFHKGEWDSGSNKRINFALYGEPFIRSLSCDFDEWGLSSKIVQNLRLIRVLSVAKSSSFENIIHPVNLRYLRSDFSFRGTASERLPQMICQLWYLQTLIIIAGSLVVAPYEIWEMPRLRHIVVYPSIEISDTLRGGVNVQDGCVLRNLQTLKRAHNLKFTEEVIARIPNIKKLSVQCFTWSIPNNNNLHNLDRLHYVQSLTLRFVTDTDFLENLSFPQSLKKLSLINCVFDWDSLTTKVGSLPNLEKLKLEYCEVGAEWNTVDGKFLHLKFLQIKERESYLVYWTSESSHFPVLQHIVLIGVQELKEIPSAIGDTLQSIKLRLCGSSVEDSAKQIVEEQESLGNEDLRLN